MGVKTFSQYLSVNVLERPVCGYQSNLDDEGQLASFHQQGNLIGDGQFNFQFHNWDFQWYQEDSLFVDFFLEIQEFEGRIPTKQALGRIGKLNKEFFVFDEKLENFNQDNLYDIDVLNQDEKIFSIFSSLQLTNKLILLDLLINMNKNFSVKKKIFDYPNKFKKKQWKIEIQ